MSNEEKVVTLEHARVARIEDLEDTGDYALAGYYDVDDDWTVVFFETENGNLVVDAEDSDKVTDEAVAAMIERIVDREERHRRYMEEEYQEAMKTVPATAVYFRCSYQLATFLHSQTSTIRALSEEIQKLKASA